MHKCGTLSPFYFLLCPHSNSAPPLVNISPTPEAGVRVSLWRNADVSRSFEHGFASVRHFVDREGQGGADRSTDQEQGEGRPAAFGFVASGSGRKCCSALICSWLRGRKKDSSVSYLIKEDVQETARVKSWRWRGAQGLQLAGLWLQSGPTGAMLLCSWLVRLIRSKARARCCSPSGRNCLPGWAEEKRTSLNV